ncbi:helix-turn-helix transcriptional regulator [Danxiaibacter flavus]|uniref:Helix-turn-helix transcriptional regulator n=1 Tax=Danxiaibacter flavus TaxID=3049108 RepID=A0ABV3ZAU1_9BACT|nr:helix-turn-helix transcriptional regulator [Chitinophagaceae bacterium DXS]
MLLNTYIPAPQLRPFIKSFLVIESSDDLVNRILPGTSMAIAFRYKGQVNYLKDDAYDHLPVSTITGLRKSVRLINYQKDSANIIVVFKEAGASAFFREPLNELFEESISLDNLIPRQEILDIEDRLATAFDTPQRIAIVEAFLSSKLKAQETDKLVQTAVEKIYNTAGIIRMKELADILYISKDAFEKRFRKTVGASPKLFSSVVRMNAAIHHHKPIHTMLDIALDAGYYDQAHFNKAFKLFTGQTPLDFFKSPPSW